MVRCLDSWVRESRAGPLALKIRIGQHGYGFIIVLFKGLFEFCVCVCVCVCMCVFSV